MLSLSNRGGCFHRRNKPLWCVCPSLEAGSTWKLPSKSRAPLLILASLADKSLVRVSSDGRYDLHELLRQFAADKASADELSATADRHLTYFLQLAEQAEAHNFGREQIPWYDRMEVELDNLRAAVAWSMQSEEAETGLRLAARSVGF